MENNLLPIGTVLRGDYRIDKHLASGGFGNTYAVTHLSFNEQMAVKEFFMNGVNEREADHVSVSVSNAQQQSQYKEQLEKFKKEARRLRSLNNSHIVHVHDLFDENGSCYYVMDYIDGESLSARLNRKGKPMAESEVIAILQQLLDALEEVHNNHLWHLDLKPSNIMLDQKGSVHLIDFGASKQLSADGGATASSALCFTLGYAPPEQVEQNMEKFGPWTDFYALGATLFNLLTTQKPPQSSDINERPDQVFAPLSNVSQNLRDLVIWLMQTNRMRRPQNVEEIRQFLVDKNLCASVPVAKQIAETATTTNDPDDTQTAIATRKAHPRWILYAAIAAVVAVVGVGLWLLLGNKANKTSSQTPLPEANIETEIDSLSYSIGKQIAIQVKEELANDLDSAYYADFLRGMNEATYSLDDKAEAAYYRGAHVAMNINIKEMGSIYFYGDEDSTKTFSVDNFLAGFNDVFNGEKPQLEDTITNQQFMLFNNVMRQNYNAYRMEKEYGENRKAGEKFLEENKRKRGVYTTESGLQYKILRQGTGRIPTAEQTVKVEYEGRLIDGTVFDTSMNQEDGFITFPLNGVIPGWTEALQLMPVGSEWEIYIPQELAYGAQGTGDVIKPFSVLIFKIKLIDIVE